MTKYIEITRYLTYNHIEYPYKSGVLGFWGFGVLGSVRRDVTSRSGAPAFAMMGCAHLSPIMPPAFSLPLTDEPQPPVRLCLRVWFGRWKLDRQLADGVECNTRALQLRAEQLTERENISRMVRDLRAVVAEADRFTARFAKHPPRLGTALAQQKAVHEDRARLLYLASRLDGTFPVSPAAAAMTQILLCDGTGPLHSPDGTAPSTMWSGKLSPPSSRAGR